MPGAVSRRVGWEVALRGVEEGGRGAFGNDGGGGLCLLLWSERG